MEFLCCRLRVRLRLFLTVDVDDSVVKVDMIAWDSDQALHQIRLWACRRVDGARLDEYDDVAAPGLAIVNERHPFGGRRQGDAVDHEVVADQQRLLHGAGGDDEVLREKSEDEESDDQDGADAGRGLEGSLFVFSLLERGFSLL